jgi:uncharacterized protein YjbI with pentapeptide repeats
MTNSSTSIHAQPRKHKSLGTINPNISYVEDNYIIDTFYSQSWQVLYYDIKQKWVFTNDIFTTPIHEGNNTFYDSCIFQSTEFKRWVDFEGTQFRKLINFFGARFDTTSDFSGSTIGASNFINAVFTGPAWFNGALFETTADFQGTNFKTYLNFGGTKVNSAVLFNNTTFGSRANFSGLTLFPSATFDFTDAFLPDTIDLSLNRKIPNEINFLTANLGQVSTDRGPKDSFKIHYIILAKSDISKIRLDYKHFRLIAPEEKYIHNTDADMFDSYEGLMRNFKTHGQDQDYRAVDIEYQDFVREHSKFNPTTWTKKFWWNYGYDHSRIYIITLSTFLFFALVNFIFLESLVTNVYTLDNFDTFLISPKRWMPRMWYSIVFTGMIFFGLTLKFDRMRLTLVLGVIYIFIMYLVGIVCLAYIANDILQK